MTCNHLNFADHPDFPKRKQLSKPPASQGGNCRSVSKLLYYVYFLSSKDDQVNWNWAYNYHSLPHNCIILCNTTIQSLVKSIAYVHSCPLLHDIFLLYKKFSICLVGTYLLTINQHRSTLTLLSWLPNSNNLLLLAVT